MVIRFIGKMPENERYSANYKEGAENVVRFEVPIPYNGADYRIYLGDQDVTDGFDYSECDYIHSPIQVRRKIDGVTVWTSGEVWLDVVSKKEDKLSNEIELLKKKEEGK